MIKEQDGRAFSVTTFEELEQDLLKDLARMSPEEIQALKIILEEAQKNEQSKLLNSIYNAEYIRQPVDMRTFILDEYYLGKTCNTAYELVIKDLEELFTGNYHEVVLCLHPDTIVPLLDGTEKTIENLANEWTEDPKPFWLYSVDPETQEIKAAEAVEPRQTGVDDYYQVTLDDGTSFTGNSRHQMIMRDGSKRMIQDMTPGDSLMPFITRLSKKSEDRRIEGYELILNPKDETYLYTHTVSASTVKENINSKYETIHHKNFRKLDNDPSNLEVLPWKEHQKLHADDRLRLFEANPAYREKIVKNARQRAKDPNSPLRKAHLDFMNSKKGRKLAISNLKKWNPTEEDLQRKADKHKISSKKMWDSPEGAIRKERFSRKFTEVLKEGLGSRAGKLSWTNRSEESRHKHTEKTINFNKTEHSRLRSDITYEMVVQALKFGAMTSKAIAKKLNCSPTKVVTTIEKHTGEKFKTFKLRESNHYVVSVEKVGQGPVYCLTVPAYGNFAVCTQDSTGRYTRNGVISSNTGSTRWGKTFSASIGICRILYELSCMRDPYKSLGLAPGSGIYIVGFSARESLAKKVVFTNIATKISASPYFKEHFPFEETKAEMRFENGIEVWARSSTNQSALGLNVVAALIDEANFMDKALDSDDLDRVEEVYNLMERRIRNTFEKAGRMPGKLFLISSKNTIDDFVNRKVRDTKDDPTVFVRDRALWDINPERYANSAWFHVLCGNETVPSKIVDNPDEVTALQKDKPENTVLVAVPEDYRKLFERNLEGSIKDNAGIAIVSNAPYINRREKIEQAVDPDRKHPFTTESHDPSRPGKFIWERIVHWTKERQLDGIYKEVQRPKVNPNFNRHVHFDPAFVDDKFGICMAHVCGWTEVERESPEGIIYLEKAPVYYIDLILRITPPTGGEIVIGDARQLVYDLSKHGFPISKVSIDGAESRDSLQMMSQKGYSTEYVSVDISPDPYDTLKMALYENRVRYYRYEPLLKELRTLILTVKGRKRKIDHTPQNSKDCADALAGCIYTLSKSAMNTSLPVFKSLVVTSGQEAWMPEQREAMVGNPTAAENKRVEDVQVMPIYMGTDDRGDWGGGGGGDFGGGGGGWSDW